MSPPRASVGARVAYDETLAAGGLIVPEFDEEVIGWANEEQMRAAGMEPLLTFGAAVPVAWVGPGPAPEPITRTTLRWRIA